jgi:hypothetical protein
MAYAIHFINVVQLQPAFDEQLGFLIKQRVHVHVVNRRTEPTMNAKPTACHKSATVNRP